MYTADVVRCRRRSPLFTITAESISTGLFQDLALFRPVAQKLALLLNIMPHFDSVKTKLNIETV
ncbi:MAG: hypothetical protein QXH44_01905 [Pyrobaculum sp.]